jgi:pimeloyl-ACP methyl ester carboxylesterase
MIALALVAKLVLAPCDLPDLDRARCGSYEVFEDRAVRAGRKLALHVVVLPALARRAAPDAVFWLHGGPGAAATQTAGAAHGGFLEGLRRDHDLVFVDQRGTGQSSPLACDLGDDPADLDVYFGPLFPPERVRACRAALEKGADLRLYTTPIAVDDIDDVRAALGYRKIDLVAASYGTIAAQVYLRRHPEHVRSVFLVGVATPGIKQPLPFARGAQHALDLLLEDCAADAVCAKAYPDLRRELDVVLARFDAGPLAVEMVDLRDRKPRRVALARASFVERLRLMLYTTTAAAFVPLVVHAAYQGDWLPFETLAVHNNPGAIVARGAYLTVTCSEGVPFISDAELAAETRDTFVGPERVRAHVAACRDWPRGAIPPTFLAPVRSGVPVLMFSGDADGSTPPWFGAAALRALAHGRQIVARHYGHQLESPCLWGILDEFVRKGSARGIDASCADEIRRPPFATELPPALRLR